MSFLTLSTLTSTLLFLAASAHLLSTQAYAPANALDNLVNLMPKSSLPSPSSLELKYVVLGIGTQNYTCTSSDTSVAPGTTGAVATLYDIGTSLKNDYFAQRKISCISCVALSLAHQPQYLDKVLRSYGFQHIIGHHFFHLKTPVFAFDQLNKTQYPIAQVSKLVEAIAPESTCPTTQTEESMKWLYLKDTTGVSEGGINTVYRIETAGGNKPVTCKGQKPHFEVGYAAQYWVFGPPKST